MRLSVLFILLACVCGAFGQPNASFYVAPTGNDANPGTQAAPWRTIQHAADKVRAGATVNVRGGTYEELVSIQVSGNASEGFITFRSFPGETAILEAEHFAPPGRTGIVTIHNQSYLRIEGFEIRNFHTAQPQLAPLGIDVMGAGSHIELLKNNVHHIQQTFEGRTSPGPRRQRIRHRRLWDGRQNAYHGPDHRRQRGASPQDRFERVGGGERERYELPDHPQRRARQQQHRD